VDQLEAGRAVESGPESNRHVVIEGANAAEQVAPLAAKGRSSREAWSPVKFFDTPRGGGGNGLRPVGTGSCRFDDLVVYLINTPSDYSCSHRLVNLEPGIG
jgi:hypothetical protein